MEDFHQEGALTMGSPFESVPAQVLKAGFEIALVLQNGGYGPEDVSDISRFLRQGGRNTVMPMVRALLNLASGNQPGASSAESQPLAANKASDETTVAVANEAPSAEAASASRRPSGHTRVPHRSHDRQQHMQQEQKHQRATKAAEVEQALVSINDVGPSKRPRPSSQQPHQQQAPASKQHRKDFSRVFFLSHLNAANNAKVVAAWGSLGLAQKLGPADIATHLAEASVFIDYFTNVATRADSAPSHLWAHSVGLRSIAYRLVRRMREQNRTNIDNLSIRPSSRTLVCEDFGSWYQGVRSSEGKGGWSKRKDWPQALWVLWVFGHLVYQAALAMRRKEALPGVEDIPY